MKEFLKLLKNYVIINRSKMFDSDYYHFLYPDINKAGINPLQHFVRFGYLEERNPSIYFDTDYYLSQNSDVKNAEINPLTHWIMHGRFEGRDPSPNFSAPKEIQNARSKTLTKKWLDYFSIFVDKKYMTIKPEPKNFTLFEDKSFLDNLYENIFGKSIDYENPCTYNEKIQLYKLYYRKKILTQLTDKLRVRDYIAEILGKDHLVPLIGHYKKVDEIRKKDLPDRFILKTNHGSGWYIICRDKNNFDWGDAKLKLNYWLSQNYYYLWREWNYKNIEPQILIEELMIGNDQQIPTDFKIHCFNGQPKMVECHVNRFSQHETIYLDMDWQRLPFHKSFPAYEQMIQKPANFDKAVDIAIKLSGDFPYIRVDFYLVEESIYLGELTFYPGAGFSKFHPSKWDDIIGSWFDISSFYAPTK